MKNKKAICPLCNELLEYHPTRMTHLWTCPACPFVGFEFYDKKDVDALSFYLIDYKLNNKNKRINL